jgi:RNA polymerase sigma-70 factor (ECF subfamily)
LFPDRLQRIVTIFHKHKAIDSAMNQTEPKRYALNSIASLIRVMHADRRFAQAFRDKAEQRITLQLRKKFFKVSHDALLDAFGVAMQNFLCSKTFKNEVFSDDQPKDGWSAEDLVRGKVGGYLYRGAYNALVQHYRDTRREISFPEQDDSGGPGALSIENLIDPDELNDPAARYENSSLLARLAACIKRLSATLRSTLDLALQELSMEEIAQQQNLHVPTVKSRLHEARKRVIECVRKGMEDDHV